MSGCARRRQPLIQPFGIGSAGAVFRTVREFQEIFTVVDGAKFADTSRTHDPRAMNSKKLRGIEFPF